MSLDRKQVAAIRKLVSDHDAAVVEQGLQLLESLGDPALSALVANEVHRRVKAAHRRMVWLRAMRQAGLHTAADRIVLAPRECPWMRLSASPGAGPRYAVELGAGELSLLAGTAVGEVRVSIGREVPSLEPLRSCTMLEDLTMIWTDRDIVPADLDVLATLPLRSVTLRYATTRAVYVKSHASEIKESGYQRAACEGASLRAMLSVLADQPSLKSLTLEDCTVEDLGVIGTSRSLTSLNLLYGSLTASALKALGQSETLREVRVHNVHFPGSADEWQQGLQDAVRSAPASALGRLRLSWKACGVQEGEGLRDHLGRKEDDDTFLACPPPPGLLLTGLAAQPAGTDRPEQSPGPTRTHDAVSGERRTTPREGRGLMEAFRRDSRDHVLRRAALQALEHVPGEGVDGFLAEVIAEGGAAGDIAAQVLARRGGTPGHVHGAAGGDEAGPGVAVTHADASGPVPVTYRVPGLDIPMMRLPPGEFQMGSAGEEVDKWRERDERPRHWVRLTRAFELGVTPVTNALWQMVMGGEAPGQSEEAARPVTDVSADDAERFCARLSAMVGGAGFRLPTEAEWEYACRAGSGDEQYGPLAEIAWYNDRQYHKGKSGTAPVGRKLPNAWGLYDMLGNVMEWTSDEWCRPYEAASQLSPVVDPCHTGSLERVVRGGSYRCRASKVRAAARAKSWCGAAFGESRFVWVTPRVHRPFWHSKNGRCSDIGFRVARDAAP